MPTIKLLKSNGVDEIRQLIADASSASELAAAPIIVSFPYDCFLETGAIGLLTSWLLLQKVEGREIRVEGDSPTLSYLARMNFQRVIGLEEPQHFRRPEAGRFIPILLVKDGSDVFEAVNAIADLVLQQFDNAREFLPAFEWAVNEIVDNVFIHAQSKSPGVVCAQLFPNLRRLEIAICDSGIGIKRSLEESFELKDDKEAILKALERGVTRNFSVGQGNGMAGSLEIITKNGGSFTVWSGAARFSLKNGSETGFQIGPSVPGTGVVLSFNLDMPVSLGNTWIGERGWGYIDAEAERIAEQGIVIKDVCSHTGSRPPAERIRRKILALLPEVDGPIKLDFSGITSFSSSFFDELLGRLNAELGNDRFNERIVISGLSELHRNMANNVIGQRLTLTSTDGASANCWIAIDARPPSPPGRFGNCAVELAGDPSMFVGVREADWVVTVLPSGKVSRVGKVLRLRSTEEATTIYFEKLQAVEGDLDLSEAGFSQPPAGQIGRIQWSQFVSALPKLTSRTIDEIPVIEDQAYIRELLQLAVMDDLLGPANGPQEQIIDMGVRDRYLVGKLAPREDRKRATESTEGLAGALAADTEEEPDTLEVHRGRHEPGAEFDSTTGRVDAESDGLDEIDTSSNQSLIPSSFGMTFCVDGDVTRIDVEASWGQYIRIYDHEHTKAINKKIKDAEGNVIETKREEVKVKVWQRVPCGGKLTIDLVEGTLSPRKPDEDYPEVYVQGTIRSKNANGDRLITLFLINTQVEPEENKDSAWVFQPELVVRATGDSSDKAIFRRRVELGSKGEDEERKALEMIYRKQVEFAVGHGVSVHAIVEDGNVERAHEVRTVVMPQSEVPVTETPGIRPEDRPAMREMVEKGHLDMEVLAAMDRDGLVSALSALASDYGKWIKEQQSRVGIEVVGYDAPAAAALDRCREIEKRLEEGIAVLADTGDEKALAAFRFANRAMARQRVHSLFALSKRRGENKTLADFDQRRNRSWRPFQLAFILLAIPSLTDPTHKDRTKPVEANADLLWFPTGGGKTEAYLGVAAFAMAVRRFQGKLGGYDGSRGLAVIMRYTLRLLTLQQFQRASALICAMELLRQEAILSGDNSLGSTPFTIGLWVGNKVTPGSTEDSHKAIQDIRDPDKYDAGGASPAQLTGCPWCGCEILPMRDVEVDKVAKRTILYCGDKLSQCEFSKGKSSRKTHPGVPVLVVDEEIYHRPPSMMIATVDKFALMAWRGEVRTLFGRASTECPRHGLLWPGADCTGAHRAYKSLPSTKVKNIVPIRPPDLIIQDEFHLISGPLGTMVGLYETAVNDLCSWSLEGLTVQPKIVASTATVRKAAEQVNNVFMRRVAIFPPHGLDVSDNFFSIQRSIELMPGRRYLGVCSPGSSRPAMLIRVYTAFLTASQALFDRFGQTADPYLTTVGYFNSLRELGGMRRLAEDDVQTRSYRVQMSKVERPGLAQRSVNNIRELTSRVSSRDIPKHLDQLEVKFKAEFDPALRRYVTRWEEGEARSIDIVLATNMLSVGVDVNRLGLMVVNGQPKGTAEYIQATSRVGRFFPGLVCTVLTWARPRDLSHYETFEHYHATFYKHVEAQSVTPFSPRAMDRGLTGTLLSVMRLENPNFNPNTGAGALNKPDRPEAVEARDLLVDRAWEISHEVSLRDLASSALKERLDEWANEAGKGGRTLGYEKKGPNIDTTVALIKSPGAKAWDNFTVPMSMREVEPGVGLIMNIAKFSGADPGWIPPAVKPEDRGGDS